MRRLLPVLAALALAACETLPPQAPAGSPEHAWSLRQQVLSDYDAWTLTGRISIMAGQEAWHGTVHWVQSPNSYYINLVGPLGQGSIHLHGTEQGVVMRTSDNNVFQADSAESLLQDHAGWQVPLSGLRYWALGLQAPGEAVEPELDAEGRIVHLSQSGWDVSYRAYTVVESVDLPRKVFMKNPQVDVRLVIDRWELESGPPAPALRGS